MPTVTAVIVYQHSLPWIDVVLRSLLHHDNRTLLHVLLVENHPNDSEGSKQAAKRFLEICKGPDKPAHIGDVSFLLSSVKGIGDPGVRHSRGLNRGFSQVTTDWTLLLDADCIPIRNGWLDCMFDTGGDIVGPPAFHNLPDYSIPHAHPSLLLFKSELARPPYWNGRFDHVRKHPDTGKHIFWDVGIGFTHMVGRRPDVRLIKLPQRECLEHGYQFYRIGDIAIHMRGTSNVSKRQYPKDQKRGLLALPELSFYQETVKS